MKEIKNELVPTYIVARRINLELKPKYRIPSAEIDSHAEQLGVRRSNTWHQLSGRPPYMWTEEKYQELKKILQS
jgi:hypothetical protein